MAAPPPLPRAHPDAIALHQEGDEQRDEPAAAAAVAAAPHAAVAVVEPDDPTVPRWDRMSTGFGPFFHDVVRAGNQSTMLNLPNFYLLGHEWHLDLYPLRHREHVGAFLKYIGKSPGNDWFKTPSVCFRVVAFHRDVVAETDQLNAPILEQRKEAAQRASDAVAEASGISAGPPSAAAVQAAAELFPLLSCPSNDPRNAEVVQVQPHRFSLGDEYEFKEWIDHKNINDYLCGPEQTLHFCVIMEGEREVEDAEGRIRELSSFLIDAGVDVAEPNASQLHWPYLGVVNQGYLSAVVQLLFHLPQFRRAVYNIPVDAQQMLELIEPDDGGSAAVVASNTSIPLALQHLFFQLQTGHEAVDTRTLTKSFGWSSADSFQQHDAHEFNRLLLDALDEIVVKQQPPMAAITRLFEGKLETYIDCAHVPFSSTRVERFLDLSLSVKGSQTLQRSLDEYVAEELMTGSNQYRAVDKERGVDLGMQDARKGVRFLRFPQVLQIRLERRQKDRLDFPVTLDLTQMEWGEEGEAEGEERPRTRKPTDQLDPAIYHLHSVLVHSGSISDGRYSAFVRPFLDDPSASYDDSPWLKFDDESVSICADAREATEKNFGDEYVNVFQCLGKKMTESNPSDGSAYMLVYIRQKLVAAKGFSEPGDRSLSAAAHSARVACGPSGSGSVAAQSKGSQ